MDNYKIKVKDEAESKEAQVLFEQLGYSNGQSKRFGFVYTQNGEIGCDSIEHWDYYNDLCQELTLPQLRDLVVLKRNDVKDATHEDQYGDKWLYLDERHYVYLNYQWSLPTGEFLERYELKPIEKSQPQDPALISGADVPALIKKGESVQFRSVFNVQGGGEWKDLDLERDEEEFSLGDLINTRFEWRLKPQTIKVELEIPAPYKAKIGGRDDTSFVLNVGRHQYCYQNEEDYTKARDALEAVFDAALRGTN
ncbi:TPA: hypothetical protein R7S05_001682 [Acinetobacter baumannii]|nr:hypothetical protein [Acinetobacter baumannii]HEE6552991.1 hypothetical protein [Acinetobacter baumannii]